MKKIAGFLMLAPLVGLSQGIHFENESSWQEILQKAGKEHKYVFVDCYATWCAPCKQMDQTVYVDDSVAGIVNQNFISVKVQMDSAKNDAQEVKAWYETAHELGNKFQVIGFPTFLFFSPDGQVLHKAIGARDRAGFLQLATAAMDSHRQYFTLLREQKQGRLSFEDMPSLAGCAQEFRDTGLASQLTEHYLRKYLQGLPDDDLWTKNHIQFIVHNRKHIHLSDSLFQRFFEDRKRVNEIMADTGYADEFINYKIYNEAVKPLVIVGIGSKREPKWGNIERSIKRQYGPTYVEKNLIDGKVVYYRFAKQWELYSKYYVLDLKLADVDHWPSTGIAGIQLNNVAFEVF